MFHSVQICEKGTLQPLECALGVPFRQNAENHCSRFVSSTAHSLYIYCEVTIYLVCTSYILRVHHTYCVYTIYVLSTAQPPYMFSFETFVQYGGGYDTPPPGLDINFESIKCIIVSFIYGLNRRGNNAVPGTRTFPWKMCST